MTGIPTWLLGRHVTTASITPQTAAADGTLTAGSVQSLVGQLDEIDVEQTNELENITPMDVRLSNYVPTGSETMITLMEILKSSGSNWLAAAANAGDYTKVILVRGGQTWTFYGIVESYNEGLRRGKSTGRLALKIVNIGSTNPTYA